MTRKTLWFPRRLSIDPAFTLKICFTKDIPQNLGLLAVKKTDNTETEKKEMLETKESEKDKESKIKTNPTQEVEEDFSVFSMTKKESDI